MKYHHPHHVYLDKTIYFLTARTYNKKHYLNTDSKKQLLLNKIRQTLTDFDFKFYAWVILNNHYQIEFKTRRGIDLSEIMNKVNGGSSYQINQIDNQGGRKVWQNYWDYCIRDEKDFWVHFNYIHYNAVKHQYANSMKEYKFSSYNNWVDKKGENWVLSCFEKYPIIEFQVDGDDF